MLLLALSFISLGHAGTKYRWYIVKGKDDVCRVISANEKTPNTIAGPYKIRENALVAKKKKCRGKKKVKRKAVKKK